MRSLLETAVFVCIAEVSEQVQVTLERVHACCPQVRVDTQTASQSRILVGCVAGAALSECTVHVRVVSTLPRSCRCGTGAGQFGGRSEQNSVGTSSTPDHPGTLGELKAPRSRRASPSVKGHHIQRNSLDTNMQVNNCARCPAQTPDAARQHLVQVG